MEEKIWLEQVSEKIKKKMIPVLERTKGKVPYTTENGVFDDRFKLDNCWWTNGFWGGIMWQMYNATGFKLYRETAEELEEKMDINLMSHRGMDHDSGFKWLPTAVANYRLHHNEESRNRGILAADNLAGRFNPVGKFIRAWNDDGDGVKAGWAIIDCMMNLPLLYWAYEETNDPRYLHIATMHADSVIKHFVRSDGSVKHIVEFNPMTGEYIKSQGGQGYENGSSWTRGQGWALYGFVLSYIHTNNEKYLDCAKRVANYFIANIPENGLIPVDFRQPEEPNWRDDTAAAIAACGLIEISNYSKGADKKIYHDAAVKMLKALDENSCNWSHDVDNILEKCTAAYHFKTHEFAIIYGDYYFIEAIWKLTGQELFIW
jgi:glycosyl hydrolase family 88